MSTPPEATRHSNSRKLQILLPLRATQNPTFQYETPCTRPNILIIQEICRSESSYYLTHSSFQTARDISYHEFKFFSPVIDLASISFFSCWSNFYRMESGIVILNYKVRPCHYRTILTIKFTHHMYWYFLWLGAIQLLRHHVFYFFRPTHPPL